MHTPCADDLSPPLIQMAQAFQIVGWSAGCHPAANVLGTNVTYTAGSTPNSVASITVSFGQRTDGAGKKRSGHIVIKCVLGGPTIDFQYNTTGADVDESLFRIDTLADCTKSHARPAPPLPGFMCSGVSGMFKPTQGGVDLATCEANC